MTTTIPYLTVAEIAHNYRQPAHRIHLLAHRRGWRRLKWQGRVYYHAADVDKELGRD